MPHLIEVAFKGNRKDFFLWDQADLPPLKAPIIVDADRGEDLGRVHAVGELAEKRSTGCAHGCGGQPPSRKARRLAGPDDVRRADQLREQDEDARRKAMERVKANKLVMKVSDAEWQWDRKKLTFYFTAEKRVDFRNLVRELAAMFRTRIELKQIGVRDEAKRLDGIGRCGRQYCSASWLPDLRPVNLGVAKDQRLSLNPAQISGACGRLMCSLRYEHEFYVESRKRFPKEGRVVRTRVGEEKVVSNDIFGERVVLRSVEGEMRTVPLALLKDEMEAVGTVGFEAAVAAHATAGSIADRGESGPATTNDELESDAAAIEAEEDAIDDLLPSASPPPRPSPSAPDDAYPVEQSAEGARRRGHRRRGRRGGRRGRGTDAPGRPEDGTGNGGSGAA